jgi:hypothetical protein
MRVLFVSGFGINSTVPNPICETRIIKWLKKYPNIQIDIACDGIVEKTPEKNWKCHPLYMLRRIKCWPSNNPDVEKACRKELCEIFDAQDYDCLFVPHKPFETVYAACYIKKKHPKAKLYIYALDPIANEVDANNGIGKHLFFLSKIAEEKVFEIADHIFHMECNKRKYDEEKYKKYADKFSYLDFPLIESRDVKSGQEHDSSALLILYSGLLNDVYRSPKYFLELYDVVSESIDAQLHFYAKGNSVKEIEERAANNKRIKSFGYIPKEDLEEKIEEAQFLLNIGNKYSDMLPSKLLTYFMTGKPIIHIKNQENDASIHYLERYGLYIVIDERDPFEENAKKLIEFMKNNHGKRLSLDYVRRTFTHNTPEWNAKQIKRVLMGDK